MLPIASFRRPLAALATTLCLLLPQAGQATSALSVEQLPNDLKGWVPWAMQGHENLACPVAHDDHQHRSCVWPSRLEISIEGRVGRFNSTVEVIGERSAVMLPGESGAWPTGVQTQDGRAWPVTSQGDRPVVWLPPGRHVLSGQIRWQQTPRTVRVPAHTGLLSVRSHGTELNPVTDRADRLWLQQTDAPAQSAPEQGNRLELRIHRRIDDAIPRRITTHYELNVAGQPREIELPAALLPDTQAEALRSGLPARLYPDGRLQVQLRAGTWQIEVDARQMKPVEALSLPPGAGPEIWSYEGHNDLHVSEIEGVESIDPDQAGVPKPWRRLPAYRMQPDSPMLIVPKTRGDAAPAGNSLQLTRELWLDFDGQGMTQLDHLNGTLSRDWRLELGPPARLGYANANGTALPINRLPADTPDTTANPGIELRHQELSLEALSRIEGRPAELPVNGWNTVLSSVDTVLHLPPGWMLLSTTGVQEISPATWTSRWRLFDLFFVLLGGIAAFRLLGAARGALMSVAIVLSWYELAFVGSSWLMLLLCVALLRALTGASRLRPMVLVAANSLLALILLVMLPFSVQQIRSIIYPGLEHSHAYNPSREHLYSASKAAETARPGSMRAKAQQALEQAADDSGIRSAPYLSPPPAAPLATGRPDPDRPGPSGLGVEPVRAAQQWRRTARGKHETLSAAAPRFGAPSHGTATRPVCRPVADVPGRLRAASPTGWRRQHTAAIQPGSTRRTDPCRLPHGQDRADARPDGIGLGHATGQQCRNRHLEPRHRCHRRFGQPDRPGGSPRHHSPCAGPCPRPHPVATATGTGQ